jgi:hypothetical protein
MDDNFNFTRSDGLDIINKRFDFKYLAYCLT